MLPVFKCSIFGSTLYISFEKCWQGNLFRAHFLNLGGGELTEFVRPWYQFGLTIYKQSSLAVLNLEGVHKKFQGVLNLQHRGLRSPGLVYHLNSKHNRCTPYLDPAYNRVTSVAVNSRSTKYSPDRTTFILIDIEINK